MSASTLFNWIFGLFGMIGTLYGVMGYYETKQTGLLLFNVEQTTVYSPHKNFPLQLTYDNKFIESDRKIEENIITVWNAGNISVKSDDIREVLTVSGSSLDTIIESRLINQRTTTRKIFSSNKTDDNGLTVKWRILDPGEGFQIAVLRRAVGEGVGISGNFGPTIKLRPFVEARISVAIALLVPTIILPALLFSINKKLRTGMFFPPTGFANNDYEPITSRPLRFGEKLLLAVGWLLFMFLFAMLVSIKVPVGGDQLSPFSTWPS